MSSKKQEGKLKCNNRSDVLKRLKVPKREDEDYKIILQKAYFSYRFTDRDFEKQIDEVVQLHVGLQRIINNGATIRELKNDPYEMAESEFDTFYSNLIKEYEDILLQDSLNNIGNDQFNQDKNKAMRMGISITPSKPFKMNKESFLTIPKKFEEFSNSLSSILNDDGNQTIDDIKLLLQLLN